MIAATRRWFKRNRTNFVVGAGVIGAGYIAGQYVLGRVREARQRMTEDRASKENLRRRFELNQEDCTYTVLALLPTIRDEIIGALPVEQITDQLQQERQERLQRLAASEAPSSEYPSAPPSTIDDASTASFVHASQLVEDRPKRSKAQLWQDMKINSIARALALLYITALLTLLTRIQLNLLGRRRYLSSVVSMASPPPTQASTISLEDHDTSFETTYGNDFETNRMYLTFSWWLLHRGAKHILERVMVAVKDVFGQVNIREDMTLERLSELIIEVRKRIEGATEEERRTQSWLAYLLPPQDQELFVIHQAAQSDGSDSASPEPGQNPLDVAVVTPSLRRLLDETADLIDSPTFALVLSRLLDAGFSHLIDVKVASEAFKANVSTDRISEVVDTKCKLAHILPVFCRQAHAIVGGELDAIAGVAGSEAVPNEYLALMDRVHDLEGFAAVIYSSNFEYEQLDTPQTASVRNSQAFTLDGSQLVEQGRALLEQTREAVVPRLEQTKAAIESTAEQAREVVATQIQQTRDVVMPRVEQACDAVFATANETIAPRVEQAKTAVADQAQQAREAVVPRVEQAADTVVKQAQQTQQAATSAARQTRDVAATQVQQAQQAASQQVQNAQAAVSSAAQQTRDAVQPKIDQAQQTASQQVQAAKTAASSAAQQTREVVQPRIDQTRAATQQGLQQASATAQQAQTAAAQTASRARETAAATAQQAGQAVKQVAAPVIDAVRDEPTPFETAIQSNTLEQSGPDLTKSIVPASSSLSESAVVVDRPTLSQSTVVVDRPTPSQSTAAISNPSLSQSSSTRSQAASQAEFESAWNKATDNKAKADVTKPKKKPVA